MTTENAYVKLSNLTRSLGIERSQHDALKLDHETLKEDFEDMRKNYREAAQEIKDLKLKLEQERERNQR